MKGWRMTRRSWAAWLALGAAASPAGAVTPEQAQTLPVEALARLVLGEAGAAVVDVDRPKRPICYEMCPQETEEQLRQPPRLSLGLVFYQRAFAASGGLEKWKGLCSTTLIHVGYDEQGRVSQIATSQRWGVPHGMQRSAASDAPQNFMARWDAENEKCRDGANLRDFFRADNDLSAIRVAVASQLIAEAAGKPGPLPFKLSCASYRDNCSDEGAAQTVAEELRPSRFAQVEQVDCADPHKPFISYDGNGCYDVRLRDEGESALIEVVDANSALRVKRVELQRLYVVH